MENNTITIHLGSENDVILSTSNPDINSLVIAIVNTRERIDVNDIEVTSEIVDFDVAGFTTLIRKLVTKYLDAIKLENTTFETVTTQVAADSPIE